MATKHAAKKKAHRIAPLGPSFAKQLNAALAALASYFWLAFSVAL